MRLRVHLLATLLVLVAADASRASTVEVVGGSEAVRYTAAAGERNDLTFAPIEDAWPAAYLVTDPGATITVGPGCVSVDPHRAACIARSGDMYHLRADLLDGDDVLHPAGFQLVRANGGPGNDKLLGGTWDDRLDGGGGTDELRGGEGDDTLADGDATGANADTLDGGPGDDTVSYEQRTEPITVDLSDPGPDGGAGEGDAVVEIENVHGGRGDDVLTGDEIANRITDEGGDNRISGNGGSDVIRAPSGVLDCGTGRDTVRGVTRRALLSRSCETIRRASFDEDFVVPAYPRVTSNGLSLPLECGTYDGESLDCSGIVTLTARGRLLARGELRPGGGRRTVGLALTPAGRRVLGRPPAAATITIRGRNLPDMAWQVLLGRPPDR